MTKQFTKFHDFYPFYLSEHRHPICRQLHFLESLLVLLILLATIWTGRWFFLILLPIIGYGFAWSGHFFFEKNRLATFRYPWYSFLGDWVIFWDVLNRRERIFPPHT